MGLAFVSRFHETSRYAPYGTEEARQVGGLLHSLVRWVSEKRTSVLNKSPWSRKTYRNLRSQSRSQIQGPCQIRAAGATFGILQQAGTFTRQGGVRRPCSEH